MESALPVSGSGASSTYALRGTTDEDSSILTDFLLCFVGLSLYSAPWYFCASDTHDYPADESQQLRAEA